MFLYEHVSTYLRYVLRSGFAGSYGNPSHPCQYVIICLLLTAILVDVNGISLWF